LKSQQNVKNLKVNQYSAKTIVHGRCVNNIAINFSIYQVRLIKIETFRILIASPSLTNNRKQIKTNLLPKDNMEQSLSKRTEEQISFQEK